MLTRYQPAYKGKMKIETAAFAANINRFSADKEISHFFALHGFLIDFFSRNAAHGTLRLFKARLAADFKEKVK